MCLILQPGGLQVLDPCYTHSCLLMTSRGWDMCHFWYTVHKVLMLTEFGCIFAHGDSSVFVTGQGIKDIVRWPRPSCPPAVRLQKKWALEYGMPSTHAMVGVSIPLSVILYTMNRYQVSLNLNMHSSCSHTFVPCLWIVVLFVAVFCDSWNPVCHWMVLCHLPQPAVSWNAFCPSKNFLMSNWFYTICYVTLTHIYYSDK
jgi:hypothetical protein